MERSATRLKCCFSAALFPGTLANRLAKSSTCERETSWMPGAGMGTGLSLRRKQDSTGSKQAMQNRKIGHHPLEHACLPLVKAPERSVTLQGSTLCRSLSLVRPPDDAIYEPLLTVLGSVWAVNVEGLEHCVGQVFRLQVLLDCYVPGRFLACVPFHVDWFD
jgi:hypothetical protein